MLFAASALHGALGFGTALVAMPLLTLAIGLAAAAPLVGLAVLVNIALALTRGWAHLDVRAAARLLAGSCAGIPLGVYLLGATAGDGLRTVLGTVLVAYGVWALRRPALPRLAWPPAAYLFGFVGGVLGGASNVNGPPVVLYGALSRWDAARLRATLSGYFLPTALVICAAHAASGLWSAALFERVAWMLPALLGGHGCGRVLGRRIHPARFARLLYQVLIALGALLLV